MLARHIQVGLELPGNEVVPTRLDLDQRSPDPVPEGDLDQAVRAQCFSPSVKGTSMNADKRPPGAPMGTVIARPNSRTDCTTASNAEVARRSCSSAPPMPETGKSRARSQSTSPITHPPRCPTGHIRCNTDASPGHKVYLRLTKHLRADPGGAIPANPDAHGTVLCAAEVRTGSASPMGPEESRRLFAGDCDRLP